MNTTYSAHYMKIPHQFAYPPSTNTSFTSLFTSYLLSFSCNFLLIFHVYKQNAGSCCQLIYRSLAFVSQIPTSWVRLERRHGLGCFSEGGLFTKGACFDLLGHLYNRSCWLIQKVVSTIRASLPEPPYHVKKYLSGKDSSMMLTLYIIMYLTICDVYLKKMKAAKQHCQIKIYCTNFIPIQNSPGLKRHKKCMHIQYAIKVKSPTEQS